MTDQYNVVHSCGEAEKRYEGFCAFVLNPLSEDFVKLHFTEIKVFLEEVCTSGD